MATETKNIRRRNWVFTINNPQQSEAELLEYLKNLSHAKYGCFGRERGDGTDGNPKGTEHYQGYIEFREPKDWQTIKGYLSPPHVIPAAHFDPRFGTRKQAHDYVFKINEYAEKAHTKLGEIYEYGKFVEDGERSDLDEIIDDIENGLTDLELSRKHQGKYARHEKWANKYRQDFLYEKYGKRPRLDIKVTYISGKTGIGKTRYIAEKHGYENIYFISDYEKYPFDNYENQPVIVFEEFRSQIQFSLMLRCIDIHPLKLPARYQNKQACYTTVYIVSNRTLAEQYPNIQKDYPNDWQAFLRRIHEVFDFDKSTTMLIRFPSEEIKRKDELRQLSKAEQDELPF